MIAANHTMRHQQPEALPSTQDFPTLRLIFRRAEERRPNGHFPGQIRCRFRPECFVFDSVRKSCPSTGRGKPKLRAGHDLLRQLSDDCEGTLLYLHELFLMPATNKMAEEHIRPLKRQQKNSGIFRTKIKALDFAIIRIIFVTARKRGWNALDILAMETAALMAQLPCIPLPNVNNPCSQKYTCPIGPPLKW